MEKWEVTEEDIQSAEHIILEKGYAFAEDAKEVIRCWDSTDVSACPGSGKTTVLLAKLKLVAERMPLDNGAGICVLSHTNVAVNEIKTKLTAYSAKLMDYPNYIGTIQTFVDRFITFPYLRSITSETPQVMDDRTYAQHMWTLLSSSSRYITVKSFIFRKHQESYKESSDIVEYVKDLYLQDGALYHKNQTAKLAGETSPSAQQYALAKHELLTKDGLIIFNETYHYAKEAVKRSPAIKGFLSKRFRFVFVDEFQDCSRVQREIVDCLFDKDICCVMRIGDPDQAIYNSDRDETEDWTPEKGNLTIASSNRYSQEIADILSPLRTGRNPISSLCGNSGIYPTIIVFDENSRHRVIETFVSLLENYQILKSNGIYKAIGWVKSETGKGLKIGDYWDGYNAYGRELTDTKYWSMVDGICDEIKKGGIYKVENILRKILVRVLKYYNCKDENGNTYTYYSVKKRLDEKHFDEYRSALLRMTEMSFYNRDVVDKAVRMIINMLLRVDSKTADAFNNLPTHFMEDLSSVSKQSEPCNEFFDPIRGIKVQFNTIHKVKGETHDATLYLETEYHGKSDLERVIPFYLEKEKNTRIDQYSRKCVYVGFSRPKKLLCVAMRATTFDAAWKNFVGWKVYDCRGNNQ